MSVHINNQMREGLTGHLTIHDVTPGTFVDFLIYVYSHNVEKIVGLERTVPLVLFAERFNIEAIVISCAKNIHREFDLVEDDDMILKGKEYHRLVTYMMELFNNLPSRGFFIKELAGDPEHPKTSQEAVQAIMYAIVRFSVFNIGQLRKLEIFNDFLTANGEYAMALEDGLAFLLEDV
jgi:hypothetical protein